MASSRCGRWLTLWLSHDRPVVVTLAPGHPGELAACVAGRWGRGSVERTIEVIAAASWGGGELRIGRAAAAFSSGRVRLRAGEREGVAPMAVNPGELRRIVASVAAGGCLSCAVRQIGGERGPCPACSPPRPRPPKLSEADRAKLRAFGAAMAGRAPASSRKRAPRGARLVVPLAPRWRPRWFRVVASGAHQWTCGAGRARTAGRIVLRRCGGAVRIAASGGRRVTSRVRWLRPAALSPPSRRMLRHAGRWRWLGVDPSGRWLIQRSAGDVALWRRRWLGLVPAPLTAPDEVRPSGRRAALAVVSAAAGPVCVRAFHGSPPCEVVAASLLDHRPTALAMVSRRVTVTPSPLAAPPDAHVDVPARPPKSSAPRRLVKWAGGKEWAATAILARLPAEMDAYYEPFAGGCAVGLEVLAAGRAARVVLTDANAELIQALRTASRRPAAVWRALQRWPLDRPAFEAEREALPLAMDPVTRAARWIGLNRGTFGGLCRYSGDGGRLLSGALNVPWTDRKTLGIGRAAFMATCALLRRAELRAGDFRQTMRYALADARSGFRVGVFLDPPYWPADGSSEWAAYCGVFGDDDQRDVGAGVGALVEAGAAVVLTNSWAARAVDLACSAGLTIGCVRARRRISRDGEGRGEVPELLAWSMALPAPAAGGAPAPRAEGVCASAPAAEPVSVCETPVADADVPGLAEWLAAQADARDPSRGGRPPVVQPAHIARARLALGASASDCAIARWLVDEGEVRGVAAPSLRYSVRRCRRDRVEALWPRGAGEPLLRWIAREVAA